MSKIGVLLGNRSTFPTALCVEAREKVLDALHRQNVEAVILDEPGDGSGTVRGYADAKRSADLFRKHADEISGILVSLPNFGDERGVADAIQISNLNVPVLVHAFPDDAKEMGGKLRRDAFCGKVSLCNNLRQYGIRFSLTKNHTVAPDSAEFDSELNAFITICRVVRSFNNVRFGQVGARPAPFNTVRYSETLLQNAGITTETVDLSEVIGAADRLENGDTKVQELLKSIKSKMGTEHVQEQLLVKMAKFGAVLHNLIEQGGWKGTALQCWTSLQLNYGIMPCTIMSLLGDDLVPSACETDISGLVSMYALTVATGQPSAILDWNNNYNSEQDKCVLFHCSNIPSTMFAKKPDITYNEILSKAVGEDISYGTLDGKMAAQKSVTFCRVDTDPLEGQINAYVGRGELTDDTLDTFGGYGVIKVAGLQDLMRFICNNGFAHHVAVGYGDHVDALTEVFSNYMGWQTHVHHHDGGQIS